MLVRLFRQVTTTLLVAAVLLVTGAHLPHAVSAGPAADTGQAHSGHARHTMAIPGDDAGVAPAEARCHLLPLIPPARTDALDAPLSDAWPGHAPVIVHGDRPLDRLLRARDLPSDPDLHATLQRFIL